MKATVGAVNDGKTKVLQAVNLVELIGKTVSLKRRGRNYVGLCPFHSEKTPSFNVDPVKQYFRCFGCKAGGNAIDFVMKRDRLTFVEALRQLAEEHNIELPRVGNGESGRQNAGERQALLDAHSAACSLFEKLLSHPQHGIAARAYLKERGFNADSIKRFQVGLTLESWDMLATNPAMKKFDPEILARAGLVKRRETGGGVYDTFRNRLMFPIRDENARIIAFGGRVMPGSEDPAKYLNSPETPLFSKSRCVFGLDLGRQKIVESRTVAVVEGYTDVVMAHQFGATNVVSILGTALTEQHVGILRRFADRIVLLFDPDTAGESAVARAVEMFLTQPVEVMIGTIPEDLDPDEYLLKHGAESFNAVIETAQDALSYKWRQLTRDTNKSDLTARQKAVREYLDLLAGARGSGPVDPLRWGQALSRVSRLTETPVEELNRMFRARRAARPAPKTIEPQSDEVVESAPINRAPLDAAGRARRWILGALLIEPNRWHDVQRYVQEEDFDDSQLTTLARRYWSHQRDEGEPDFAAFLSLLDEEEKSLAIELVEEVQAMADLKRTVDEAVAHLALSRRRIEEKKTLAALRRTTDQPANASDSEDRKASKKSAADEDEIALLSKLQEQVRRPDLGRL